MRAKALPTLLLLCAWLVPSGAAHAQTDAPADSIHWQRYYPLAVGNVWEYHWAETGDILRSEIIGDTLVGGRRYFLRRSYRLLAGSPYHPNPSRSLSFMRYDEEGGGVVGVGSLEADTAHLHLCSDHLFERDLRLAFGTALACPPGTQFQPDSVRVTGRYDVEWAPWVLSGTPDPIPVAAVKEYSLGGFISTTFVADIGPVWEGNLNGPLLHYARIDGVEYGEAELNVGVEPGQHPEHRLHVRALRNPVQDRALFEVRGVTTRQVSWEVVDAAGRAVLAGVVALDPAGRRLEMHTGGLASGSYHLVIRTGEEAGSASFTVVR